MVIDGSAETFSACKRAAGSLTRHTLEVLPRLSLRTEAAPFTVNSKRGTVQLARSQEVSEHVSAQRDREQCYEPVTTVAMMCAFDGWSFGMFSSLIAFYSPYRDGRVVPW